MLMSNIVYALVMIMTVMYKPARNVLLIKFLLCEAAHKQQLRVIIYEQLLTNTTTTKKYVVFLLFN